MSHIEEGKTKLVFADLPSLLEKGDVHALAQHPCLALLRQAVTMVAQQYQGEVKSYYYNYYDEQLRANTGLALHIPMENHEVGKAVPLGIGLVIEKKTGSLIFRGDSWDVDKDFYQHLQKLIVQKYTVLAHMAALKQMHYQVSVEEIEGQINITGVTYA